MEASMTRIRFGLRMPPCADIRQIADFVREAEDAGFDNAWFPDSQFLWRDVWATIALAATRTERITLGTAVTNLETRNPAVTAAAASTIEEIAPGRFVLGISTGDSSIKTLGLAPTRLGRMREEVDRIRRLMSGEALTYGGTTGIYANRQMRVKSAPGHAVPIYIAATAPKALELCGEIADGVLLQAGLAPDLLEAALAKVRLGAENVGRRFEDIDICLTAHTAVADQETATRLVKPLVVTTSQLGGGGALRAAGIEVEIPPLVGGVYPDVTHAEDWDLAIEAASKFVDDETSRRYAESFCLAGPPEVVVDRIRAAVDLGVTSFYILGHRSYALPRDLLEAFRDEIIPRVRGEAPASA
jgi:5,10-methylenetetrahydromethanopterin reductase